MNRFLARAGNRATLALTVAVAVIAAGTVRGSAAGVPSFWFAGTKLIMTRTASVNGELAVSLQDPAFAGFLARLGAAASWQPGERYVVVTAADRHVVSFTLGDATYTDGTSRLRAPFAPYAEGADAYVPFLALARALYVAPIFDAGDVVLQPQLGSLDVSTDGARTIVTLRGAIPLRWRKVAESGERVQLAFAGIGSSLAPARQTLTAGLSAIEIATTGPARNPTTVVTFDGAAQSAHALYPATSPNEITLGFAPQGVALAGGAIPAASSATAALASPVPLGASPSALPTPAAAATGAMITEASPAPSFAPPPSAAPAPPVSSTPIAPPAWKFGGTPAPPPPGSNPRLIVIDPGHGGTDTGAMHNGLVEKVLTLDIGLRLRAILVSRGWIVKMTRETDRDVVAPHDDAQTELQGRCDIANDAGARLFVSVHINAFTSPEMSGTTAYYYKDDSEPFAADVERRLVPLLGTKDDGTRRANFYVIRHTTMPAILVETAFLSNPDDAARLRSPAFLQRVAEGIADGIGDFAGSPKSAPAPAAMTGE